MGQLNNIWSQEEDTVPMYGKNAHQAYQSIQVTTVDKGRLLLMMYEGAIKFLKQSRQGLEANDIPKFCRFLSKAQAIIAELMNTLDFEKGGTIARDLDRLYDFMLYYLTEANLHRDAQRITRTIGLIETIYSAYKEIIEGDKRGGEIRAKEEKVVGEAIRRVEISL